MSLSVLFEYGKENRNSDQGLDPNSEFLVILAIYQVKVSLFSLTGNKFLLIDKFLLVRFSELI